MIINTSLKKFKIDQNMSLDSDEKTHLTLFIIDGVKTCIENEKLVLDAHTLYLDCKEEYDNLANKIATDLTIMISPLLEKLEEIIDNLNNHEIKVMNSEEIARKSFEDVIQITGITKDQLDLLINFMEINTIETDNLIKQNFSWGPELNEFMSWGLY